MGNWTKVRVSALFKENTQWSEQIGWENRWLFLNIQYIFLNMFYWFSQFYPGREEDSHMSEGNYNWDLKPHSQPKRWARSVVKATTTLALFDKRPRTFSGIKPNGAQIGSQSDWTANISFKHRRRISGQNMCIRSAGHSLHRGFHWKWTKSVSYKAPDLQVAKEIVPW